ncbi:general transcription factor II-I repeat domain-containing protein 2 [Trichonephila clavipes]|nr:general transcription factor II-I repeat domain-containing protein 2 [Trichonephila clavipes]
MRNCLEDNKIDLNKIVSIATDRARSMTGKNKRATILQSKINHEILTFHCIIHQEELCAQTFLAEIVEVMNLVIKIVNSILSKALHHRQFKEFLSAMETQYSEPFLHNKVRWLSKELKSKLEELEVQKCMYVKQQKLMALKEMRRVEALIFDVWNSLPQIAAVR